MGEKAFKAPITWAEVIDRGEGEFEETDGRAIVSGVD